MIYQDQTPIAVISNLILIAIICFFAKKQIYSKNAIELNFIKFLCLVFCVFSFWGADWYGYKLYYTQINSGYEIRSLESIYIILMEYTLESYIVFRTVVWGCGLLFVFATFKKVFIKYEECLYIFVCCSLIWFSYARVSLAMAIMFYGMTLLHSVPNKAYKSYGLVLIFLSYFFHKSSIFCILLIGISEFFVSLNISGRKKSYILLIVIISCWLLVPIVFIPSMYSVASDESNFMNNYIIEGIGYFEQASQDISIGGAVERFLERFPYYIISFSVLKMLTNNELDGNKIIESFGILIILIVGFSSSFLLNIDANVDVFYGRCIRYAQIPATILICHQFINNKKTESRLAFRIMFCCTVYTLCYTFYNTLVK